MNTYRIYPTPHETTYSEERFKLPAEMAVRLNFDADTAIEKRLSEVLDLRGITLKEDAAYTLEIRLDGSLPEDRHDIHEIGITAAGISVRARELSGVYYALTTLYHVFSQSAGEVRAVTIRDYADLQLRGLIEGYYGIPWSDESRESIMTFGSYFKMNIYAFAPKDDPYHRDLWGELYPADKLEVIAKLARIGEEHYSHYVWTIAPFKAEANPIRDENKEEGLALVIAKFEQLYEAGVRQFGVLGDDVGNLPYDTVVYVMNELNKWRHAKGDVRDLIFCPEGYNMADWAFKDGSELNKYDAEFDQDIHIFFTGMSTCTPVTGEAVRAFKTLRTAGQDRRDPLFWMNWPVNDIDRETYRRLFLGKGEVYEPGVQDMTGVLTNPMEEAEASKVALFATLDYAWNVHDFDADSSWEDSFPYIEPHAPAELHEIAKHMSEISNGAKADAEESVELAALAGAYFMAEEQGDRSRAKAAGDSLKAAYQAIADAVEGFRSKTRNSQLLKEMTPYLGSLSDKAQAAVLYLEAIAEDDLDKCEAADALAAHANTHLIYTRTAEFPSTTLYAESGRKVINGNLAKLREICRPDTETVLPEGD